MAKVTPELLLEAYRAGIFPMAEDRRATDLAWFDPAFRGILPIPALHVPKRLTRTIYKKPYRVTFDQAFERVIRNCADVRDSTWINDEIIALYTALHRQGHAHSVEAWDGRVLAGGVYGISIGAAFFGESMFSVRTDASKIALVYLVARLWRRGYELFDTQYVNEHLKQFGVLEIPRGEYRRLLKKAVAKEADFNAVYSLPPPESSPSSNEPGSLSSGGTGCLSVAGALGAGLPSALGAGASSVLIGSSSSPSSVAGSSAVAGAAAGVASEPGSAPDLFSGDTFLAAASPPLAPAGASGAPFGAVSDENTSDFDVAAFLHSITQTS